MLTRTGRGISIRPRPHPQPGSLQAQRCLRGPLLTQRPPQPHSWRQPQSWNRGTGGSGGDEGEQRPPGYPGCEAPDRGYSPQDHALVGLQLKYAITTNTNSSVLAVIGLILVGFEITFFLVKQRKMLWPEGWDSARRDEAHNRGSSARPVGSPGWEALSCRCHLRDHTPLALCSGHDFLTSGSMSVSAEKKPIRYKLAGSMLLQYLLFSTISELLVTSITIVWIVRALHHPETGEEKREAEDPGGNLGPTRVQLEIEVILQRVVV
ncbi:hypothetical protein CB1_002300022 [Camelus ferus]|nr:hypothetical protein CB1_002300022 [Camelus ferus]